MLLSDKMIKVMEVAEPSVASKSVGAVANITLDVTALTSETLRPYSHIGVKTPVLHAVAFRKKREDGFFLSFNHQAPPGYELYIRRTSLYQELLDHVEALEWVSA